MSAPVNRTRPIIIYAIGILALFVGMGFYSTRLQRLKADQGLGEAAIGQIDTGSFMLKLALLGGARGVAANVLWTRAIDLQRVHEWDKLKSTIDLITKLQPHFKSVWTFQGWNLAYNVSVEWDSPEDKYDWIRQGIKFLKEGVSKNEDSPDLYWDTAWTYYHKLGFADEAIILRKLFRDDEDEEFKTYSDIRNQSRVKSDDNFLLGYGWFTNAVAKVDAGAERLGGGDQPVDATEYVDKPQQHKGRPGDLAFRSMPAHAQTRYASGLEKESIVGVAPTFGELAQIQWRKAFDEWVKMGTYTFVTPNEVWREGKSVVKQPVHIDDASRPEQWSKMDENIVYWTNRWADQMNYRYWKDRSAAEAEPDGVKARRFFYEGTKALKAGRFVEEKDKNGNVRLGAVECYVEGLKVWKALLDRHTDYRNDELNMKDTGLIVKRYRYALKQVGRDLPNDTPFIDKLKAVEGEVNIDPFDALEVLRNRRRPAR